jgi:hypothetical protein
MNVKVMPPTREIWAGINASRDILSRSYFRIPACTQGLEALSAYQSKETVSGGSISAEPLHNWASHDADSFRYACEAIVLGMVKTPAARRMAEIVPEDMNGAAVDVGYVRERQRAKSQGMALDSFKL